MNIHEIDWYRTWIRNTVWSLDDGMSRLRSQYEDIEDVAENCNTMIGLGFVAIQIHLSSTLSNLESVLKHRCPAAQILRSEESPIVEGTKLTKIEAIWGAANYFKHFDEIHAKENPSKDTQRFMSAFELNQYTHWPFDKILWRLCDPIASLQPLLDESVRWRKAWFYRLHAACGTKPLAMLDE